MNKINRFSRAFNFAVLFYVFSGSLYFLYYILQTNKLIYLLISISIYFLSLYIRKFLLKENQNLLVTEVGMLFVSMTFLAYTLYLLKLDLNVGAYLQDNILTISGGSFIFIFLMSLLPEKKSSKHVVLSVVALFGVVFLQDKINLFF